MNTQYFAGVFRVTLIFLLVLFINSRVVWATEFNAYITYTEGEVKIIPSGGMQGADIELFEGDSVRIKEGLAIIQYEYEEPVVPDKDGKLRLGIQAVCQDIVVLGRNSAHTVTAPTWECSHSLNSSVDDTSQALDKVLSCNSHCEERITLTAPSGGMTLSSDIKKVFEEKGLPLSGRNSSSSEVLEPADRVDFGGIDDKKSDKTGKFSGNPKIIAKPFLFSSEDCMGFDYRKAAVKNIKGSWKIVIGKKWFKDFGKNKKEALQTLKIIKRHRMDKQCFVGRPNPSMEYYLVQGKAPTGSFQGEDCLNFNPARIEVKNIDNRWKIVEGSQRLMDVGNQKEEAITAFKIIQKYGFRRICFVGRPRPSLTYFLR